jgi:hypothetical protein
MRTRVRSRIWRTVPSTFSRKAGSTRPPWHLLKVQHLEQQDSKLKKLVPAVAACIHWSESSTGIRLVAT